MFGRPLTSSPSHDRRSVNVIRVLYLDEWEDSWVYRDPEWAEVAVEVDLETYTALGSPMTITVILVPGGTVER